MKGIDDFLDEEMKALNEEKASDQMKNLNAREYVDLVLNKIRESIQRREFAEAEEIYINVQKKLAELPVEERISVYDQLSNINRTFLKSLDELSVEMDGKIALINSLMEKGEKHISSGNGEMALKIYAEAKEVYSELPDYFIERKREVQNRLFDFYRGMKGLMEKGSAKKFKRGMDELKKQAEIVKQFIAKQQIDKTVDAYNRCVLIYNQLPDGFLSDKARMYGELLKLYEEMNIKAEILGLQEKLKKIGTVSLSTADIIKVENKISEDIPPPGMIDKKEEKMQLPEVIIRFQKNKYKTISPKEDRSADIQMQEHQILPAEPLKGGKGKNKDTKFKLTEITNEQFNKKLMERKKERGMIIFEKGFYSKAADEFRNILKMDPANDGAKEMLDKCIENEKKAREVQAIRNIKEEKPIPEISAKKAEVSAKTKGNLIKRKKERGMIAFEKGFYSKAADEFRNILKIDPANDGAKEMLDKSISKLN